MFYKNKKTDLKNRNSLLPNTINNDIYSQLQESKKDNMDIIDIIDQSVDFGQYMRPKPRNTCANLENYLTFTQTFDLDNNSFLIDDKFNDDSKIINSYNDNKLKILYLTKEKMQLNDSNIKLLQLLNENNRKNVELKGYIDEYRKKGLLSKAKFIGHLEKLKHRSKEISIESDKFQKKSINYQNVDEVKKENEYLIKKIEVKNNDFQNLYDFVMEIISNNEPYIKEVQNNVNELNSFKNNELKASNSFNKNISGEIIQMKNDYEKLKIKYNELLEKMKIEDKEESKKQKVKFISKDKSQKTKEEYESKIKKLKEDNQKLKNDYKQQLEEVKNELSDIKLKYNNKEKELKLLSEKYENIMNSLNEQLNEKKQNLKDGNLEKKI
jgi:hypothetical protein